MLPEPPPPHRPTLGRECKVDCGKQVTWSHTGLWKIPSLSPDAHMAWDELLNRRPLKVGRPVFRSVLCRGREGAHERPSDGQRPPHPSWASPAHPLGLVFPPENRGSGRDGLSPTLPTAGRDGAPCLALLPPGTLGSCPGCRGAGVPPGHATPAPEVSPRPAKGT